MLGLFVRQRIDIPLQKITALKLSFFDSIEISSPSAKIILPQCESKENVLIAIEQAIWKFDDQN